MAWRQGLAPRASATCPWEHAADERRRCARLHFAVAETPAPDYKRHRFPPEIISHAVWLYSRFALSYRDAEELLTERGVIVTYESIRRWCGKFGQTTPTSCAARRPGPATGSIMLNVDCATRDQSAQIRNDTDEVPTRADVGAAVRRLPWGTSGRRRAWPLAGAWPCGSSGGWPPTWGTGPSPPRPSGRIARALLQGEALWHVWLGERGYTFAAAQPATAAFTPLFALPQLVGLVAPSATVAGALRHAALVAALAYSWRAGAARL